MKVFLCDDVDERGNPILNSGCGVIDHIVFDGYDFGERTLEGVKFKAQLNAKYEVEISTVDDWITNSYLCGLNREHWTKAAKDYRDDLEVAESPYCGNEIAAHQQEH